MNDPKAIMPGVVGFIVVDGSLVEADPIANAAPTRLDEEVAARSRELRDKALKAVLKNKTSSLKAG